MLYLTSEIRCKICIKQKQICINVQISDFGLSRDLSFSDYYTTKGGEIPVRWTAPEVLTTLVKTCMYIHSYMHTHVHTYTQTYVHT